jgi:CRISPR/Cas system-associated protein Csm6
MASLMGILSGCSKAFAKGVTDFVVKQLEDVNRLQEEDNERKRQERLERDKEQLPRAKLKWSISPAAVLKWVTTTPNMCSSLSLPIR